jgi:DNA polymerase (family X)
VAAEIAGALRRRLEIVDRLVLVAASEDPDTTLGRFRSLNASPVDAEAGEDLARVELNDGVTATLRCVVPEAFVATVVWETGSELHLQQMAERAAGQSLLLDRDGLHRGGETLRFDAEDGLYAALGLGYVEPELREGLGEVERAASGSLPTLVQPEDLAGTFHCHTTYSDGKATLEEMAEGARARGWHYLGIADHSRSAGYAGGLSVERVRAQQAETDAWNARHAPGDGRRRKGRARGAEHEGIRLFKGIEADILVDGSLDYPDEVLATFDFVIGSVHSSFALPAEAMTERVLRALGNPYLTMLGHPTGRLLLTRRGYDLDLERVFAAAAEHGVIIEINSDAHRLDLGWREAMAAAEQGILIAINPDAHSVAALDAVAFGVNMARKAGLGPEQIVNCWPLERVERYLAQRKQASEAPADG